MNFLGEGAILTNGIGADLKWKHGKKEVEHILCFMQTSVVSQISLVWSSDASLEIHCSH